MSSEDKLNSGRYTLVSKLTNRMQLFLVVISVVGFLAVGVRTWDLTFDNQLQKYDMLKHEKDTFHLEFTKYYDMNNDLKMMKHEVSELKILAKKTLENQTKIGADLQYLKRK